MRRPVFVVVALTVVAGVLLPVVFFAAKKRRKKGKPPFIEEKYYEMTVLTTNYHAINYRVYFACRLSDTILQRQNQLLGARPAGDAKRSTAAAARPPQVDLPMTKPVLLRGQRLQQQQPPRPSFDRGLMGFSDEAQWMRKRVRS